MSTNQASKLSAPPPNTAPTVSHGRAMQCADALASLGLDARQLCQQAGFDFSLPEVMGRRCTSEQLNRLWNLAESAYGSATVGLAAASISPACARDLVDYAMISCADLAAALERGVRYSDLADEAMPMRTVTLGQQCQLLVTDPALRLALPSARIDFTLLSLHKLCRWMTGRDDLLPVRVELSHAPPPDPQRYADAFGCPVRFNAASDSLTYQCSELDWPLLTGNVQMAELHERLADESSAYLLGTDISNAIRRLLETDISGGAPSRKQMAKALHLSDSTLHRRLQAEGLSYQSLLDATRRRLAQRYLAKGDLPVAEVAYRLGFADCSCLARACKRWFQLAPRRLRGLTMGEVGAGPRQLASC